MKTIRWNVMAKQMFQGAKVDSDCFLVTREKVQQLKGGLLPCPSLSIRVCSNSCPLSQWHHPTISSSVVPFSSCPQSFPASRSFPMSQLFTSYSQSLGASASASVLPMNIHSWFPSEWTGLISLQPKGLPTVFSSTTVQKHQCFNTQPSWSNSHIHIWLLGKTNV